MNDLFDFIDRYLLPALHQGGMAHAFPNIHFEKRGNKWGAKNYLNGTPHSSRWDKIFTTAQKPHLITEQGGDSISLIKFYQNLTGASFREAVTALSSACSLTPPEREESESYRAYREKQEKLEELCTLMKRDLRSDDGGAALSYLRGRGYSDEFIDFAEFGFISAQRASELRSLLTSGTDSPTYLSKEVGVNNILSLPYRTGGYIQGFVFRRIDGVTEGKYSDVFISQKASKSFNLFGLTGLPLTGKADKDRDITIVEGEIDALSAQFAGVENVVAASGGSLSPEALKEAKRKGVLRVTILFDTEDTAEAQEATDKKIAKAVETIRLSGLEPFVASFPQVYDSEGKALKVDTDSYLHRDRHTGEQLSHLIKYGDNDFPTTTGSLWLYYQLFTKYSKMEEEGGEYRIAETDFSDFRREVIQLCKKASPSDRARILSEFSRTTQGILTEAALQEEAEKELQEQRRLQALSEAQKIATEVESLCKEGKMDEAIALGKKLTDLSEHNREAEYSSALTPLSLSRIREAYRNKPSGIHTGYYFGTAEKPEELIIQAAALTYICAPTSHGKTTFLQNLALRTAQSRDAEGDVVFITFEESVEDITTEFLALYCGEQLSLNLLRSIRSYYERGENYFRGDGIQTFTQKEKEFDSLLRTGKLRIFRRKNQIGDLSGLITYLSKTLRVKAVFVDYVQRIKNQAVRGTKKDVIEAVCDELMNVSLSTGLPVILGAQLNREAFSPVEMENQNIADASDIEHSANAVVLLWNSGFKPLAKSTKYFTDGKRDKLSDEAQAIESRGFTMGREGTLYAVLSKNRGSQRGLSAIFSFNGNTRAITQLNPSAPTTATAPTAPAFTQLIQPREEALPFDPPTPEEKLPDF